ncbi:hypothetical protein FA15DRAFT_424818 [Coprinopsis marcescibilis]|uniref:Uncharacterized protein n=1 Tax=Coprinopsis marcescibilis TaxID=230819 RepID=A0A5C3L8E5_COPMA|nr:hypothetical protein FA15DRAFT_424818 [Coprinopsis marcescibilis]
MFGGLVHVLPINQKHIDALQKHEFKDIQDVFEEAGLPIRNFIVVTTLWDQLSSSFSFDEAVEREKEIQSGALNELYAGGVTFYRWGMFNLSQESPFPTRQHFVTPLELLSHLVESWALPTLEQPVSVIAPDSPLDDLKARISALEEEEINREHELARVRLEEQLEYLNGARTPDINTYDSASIPGTNAARRGSVGSGNSIYGYASSSRGRSMVRASADYALDRDDSPGQQLLKEDLYKQLRESHGFPAIPSTNASSRSSSPLLPPLPPQVHPKSEVDRSKSSPKSTLSTRANSLEAKLAGEAGYGLCTRYQN